MPAPSGPRPTRASPRAAARSILDLADQAPPVQAAVRADLHAPPAAVAIALDVVAPPPAPVPARADRAQARPPPLATFLDKQSILR